ncbi:Fic family protein [Nocardia sp. CNY236]|uniref:Fic/DOC family protein n=1 Tax=Nocardia sp. CNY236 TaxID=1169152 RepID=UPI000403D5E5|nr:Fic family protein [Nocardia sp. CNY236]
MSEPPQWRDPYLWPAPHDTVLRNRYGLKDPDQLKRREYRETLLRETEIRQGRADIPTTGTAEEWRAIHLHLFSNVYPWAGEYRTVRLFKSGLEFAAPSGLEQILADTTGEISQIDWSALDLNGFIDRAARAHMLLNYAHPFREGNGRSEKIFLDRQIASARYELDYTQVTTHEWNTAAVWSLSHKSHGQKPTDHRDLLGVFRRITVPRSNPSATEKPLDPTIHRDLNTILATIREQVSGSSIGDAIDAAGLTKSIQSTSQTAAVSEQTDRQQQQQPSAAPSLEY